MLLCCRFRRLYPDSALHVEAERLEAIQASLFGVFAAQALLLAFSLKLKMSAALHQTDKGTKQGQQCEKHTVLRMLGLVAQFAACGVGCFGRVNAPTPARWHHPSTRAAVSA